MAARSSSSGFKNIRAMFENKEESSTSPPDRGRSPALSIGGGSNGTSPGPRPLSKVRTSFVAVERSGQFGAQIGLKRNDSTEGTSAETRRPGFSINEETHPQEIAEKNNSINTEVEARKLSTTVKETIPESALETPEAEVSRPGLTPRTSYMNGKRGTRDAAPAESISNGNSGKATSVEDKNPKVPSGGPNSGTGVVGGSALNNSGGFGETLNGNTEGKISTPSSKSTEKSTPARGAAKPAPITTSKISASTKPISKAPKSPATPKTPTTPGHSTKTLPTRPAPSSQSKDQIKAPDPKPSKAMAPATNTVKPSRPSTVPAASTSGSKKPPHQSPQSMFNKPRPKSPTRPAKLPASMTAPTASSLSKINGSAPPARQSLAPSNGTQPHKTVARSQSRSSLVQSSDRSNIAPKAELRRIKSTIGKTANSNDRPALGRPPIPSQQKQPTRQSLPKQTDEGFLARMMRPTTASAQKTHDRAVTPPRSKPSTRPVTRDGSVSKPLDGSPISKKHPPMPQIPRIEEPTPATPEAKIAPKAKGVATESETIVPEAEPLSSASKSAASKSDAMELTSSRAEGSAFPTTAATVEMKFPDNAASEPVNIAGTDYAFVKGVPIPITEAESKAANTSNMGIIPDSAEKPTAHGRTVPGLVHQKEIFEEDSKSTPKEPESAEVIDESKELEDEDDSLGDEDDDEEPAFAVVAAVEARKAKAKAIGESAVSAKSKEKPEENDNVEETAVHKTEDHKDEVAVKKAKNEDQDSPTDVVASNNEMSNGLQTGI